MLEHSSRFINFASRLLNRALAKCGSLETTYSAAWLHALVPEIAIHSMHYTLYCKACKTCYNHLCIKWQLREPCASSRSSNISGHARTRSHTCDPGEVRLPAGLMGGFSIPPLATLSALSSGTVCGHCPEPPELCMRPRGTELPLSAACKVEPADRRAGS